MRKLLFAASICFGVVACDENGVDKSNQQAKITQLTNIVTDGPWAITYFFDTDHEETANFSSYSFEFAPSGAITATNGSTSVSGSWSVTPDNSSDDNNSESDNVDFNLSFSAPTNFEDLSEDWEIISQSVSRIELRHISGGNGGTDLLTIEKI
jgi:hypothetical protein